MELYNRIRQRREELHMTQDELAQAMGYKSRSSINKIELGKSDIPQSKIKSFAEALKTTPEYLMGLEENTNKKNEELSDAIIIDCDQSSSNNDLERSHRFSSYIKKISKLTDDQKNIIYGMIDNMVPPKNNDVNVSLLAAHEDDDVSETDRQNDIEILKNHIKNNKQ